MSGFVSWLEGNSWLAAWLIFFISTTAAALDIYYLLFKFYYQTIGKLSPEERAALGRGLRELASDRLTGEQNGVIPK